MSLVTIKKGRYSIGKNKFKSIQNIVIRAIDPTIQSNHYGNYVVVDGTNVRGLPKRNFKIFVDDHQDIESAGEGTQESESSIPESEFLKVPQAPQPQLEASTLHGDDDEAIKARIAERFEILDSLARAASYGEITGLVVSGPPGVGKSHGVEYAMQATITSSLLGWDPLDPNQARRTAYDPKTGQQVYVPSCKMVSGYVSPVGLYELLYAHSEPQEVLVFDDCDSVLFDDVSLNLLKTALNTTGARKLTWASQGISRMDAPASFEFKGSIIFISNIKFDKPKVRSSTLAEHLSAIMSRVYYLDLTMDTMRDKYLRIEQVCKDNGILAAAGLDEEQVDAVMVFFEKNIEKFREVSIRTVQKIGNLCKLYPDTWQRIAAITTHKSV